MKSKEVKVEEKKKKSQLEVLLNDHSDDHYNFCIPSTFQISTGSIELDTALDGGLGPGIHRFGGASEGGKTSSALEVMKNFLETVPNSKAFIIKAEGRLSEKIKKRSGIRFVDSAADWKPGTCFVFKTNVYEVAAQFIHDFVKINPEEFKYCFLIDSLDGMMKKADLEKSFEEAVQVCGPNVLTKLLFKKLSLPMSELGHLLLVIVQVIAKPDIKGGPNEQTNMGGGGGNAAIHFANFILTFGPRFKDDLILCDNKVVNYNFGESNIVGHWAKVTLEKTENEKSKQRVRYPIKYATATEPGRIWSEMELKAALERLGLVSFKGAWGKFSERAMEKMKESGIEDVPENFNGTAKFNEYISNPDILQFWKKELREYKLKKDFL